MIGAPHRGAVPAPARTLRRARPRPARAAGRLAQEHRPQLARSARKPSVKMGLARAARGATVANPRSVAGDRRYSATLELYLIRHGIAAERGERVSGRLQAAADERRHHAPAKGSEGARGARGRVRPHRHESARCGPGRRPTCLPRRVKSKPSVSSSDALAPAGTPAAVIQDLAKRRAQGTDRARRARAEHRRARARLIGARLPMEFKKATICRIDFETLPPKGTGQLRWFITPKRCSEASADGRRHAVTPAFTSAPFGTMMMPSRM